jgi:hypothetical protein
VRGIFSCVGCGIYSPFEKRGIPYFRVRVFSNWVRMLKKCSKMLKMLKNAQNAQNAQKIFKNW